MFFETSFSEVSNAIKIPVQLEKVLRGLSRQEINYFCSKWSFVAHISKQMGTFEEGKLHQRKKLKFLSFFFTSLEIKGPNAHN